MSDKRPVLIISDLHLGRSRMVETAEEVAAQLTAGMIGVNQGCGGAEGSPWVGAMESGYGWHSGKYGHRQFCQVRTISRAAAKPSKD